ncbi:MAG: nicotinate (nicotinamide) nucleotide adenylyltransferase [Bdellovibrionia bacterium]
MSPLSAWKTPRWNEITAVLGGRFDPPHLGHREAVRGLFQNPGVKNVLILPSGHPPHKGTQASLADRVEMARLAFQTGGPDAFPSEVSLDLTEVKWAQNHPHAPTYSFEIIQQLKTRWPELAFVIGTDQLLSLPSWHRFPELLKLCHWIILERKSNTTEAGASARKALSQWSSSGLLHAQSDQLWRTREGGNAVALLPTNAPALSSTEIRKEISQHGRAPENSLPSEVLAYLMQKRLYGIEPQIGIHYDA